MKPEEFIYWLEGFLETDASDNAKIIKDKLNEVKEKAKEPIHPAQWPSSPIFRNKDLLQG